MVEKAQQRTSFRLTNVSSKLSRNEAERLDLLAKKRGQQRGEFIRRIILDELTRDSEMPTPSAELSEIIGFGWITVAQDDGKQVTYNPERLSGITAYRASQDARIYTNDAGTFGERLSTDVTKTSA